MQNGYRCHLNESFFVSDIDQANIFVRSWQPKAELKPKAVVQITHGICEHSGRYEQLACFLSDHGYIVYAIDLRGHGLTAGLGNLGKAGITAWSDMTSDIAQLSNMIKRQYPDLPLIVFGHSMGSALMQSHIQNNADLLDGAILCGTLGMLPGLDQAQIDQLKAEAYSAKHEEPSRLFAEMLHAFNQPYVKTGEISTGCEWMTTSQDEIHKFINDSLCGKPFSSSMMYSVIEGFRSLWLPENESRVPVNLDLLIIAGTEDLVGMNTISIQSLICRYMKFGHLALSYRFYPKDRHEILNGPNKNTVQKDILLWIESILAR
jgi:alpha-beta hydrolase superfamily lysophospholipase